MKRPRIILTITTLILLCTNLFGQDLGAQAYSDKYSKEIIHYLTDEKFQGRESGTKELKGVIKYISKEFKKSGTHSFTPEPLPSSDALLLWQK